jgi:hypothetical protein
MHDIVCALDRLDYVNNRILSAPTTLPRKLFHASAVVLGKIPSNTEQYGLDTEQFGHHAHATPLINPPPGPTEIEVTGSGHPLVKVGATVKGIRT